MATGAKKNPPGAATGAAAAKPSARAGSAPRATSTASTPDEARAADASGEDLVLVHGRTEDGDGLRVIRRRPGAIELAEIRPMVEGQPLVGDLVRLHPREESPLLFRVETQYRAPRQALGSGEPAASASDAAADPTAAADGAVGHSGPARVATDQYRDGWGRIWGQSRRGRTLH